jgi:hypothetical protein
VTTGRDWGGWGVPGAEYDLDPYRIERQTRIIMHASVFMTLLEEFIERAEQEPEKPSDDMLKLAHLLAGRSAKSQVRHSPRKLPKTLGISPGAL